MYVYLIQSIKFPTQFYVGVTKNFKRRLKEHNTNKSCHTSKFKPWKLKTVIWFDDDKKAIKFERYLKHGSGHAFAKKHLW